MAISQTYCDFATGNDYKGASFVDGAFTVADMTLTKAGAFAASKVNHWLYLADNGSGNVTAGYYRIASVTSNDAVVLAASPKSGATDPTDVVCTQHDGTTTLPWRSVQGALDLITRDATNGDQVNVKAGSTNIASAAIVLTTYGNASEVAPLVIRGYTATANDGGQGYIATNNGAFATIGTTTGNLFFIDLRIGSSAGQVAYSSGTPCTFINCLFDGAGYGIHLGQGGFVYRCTFTHAQSRPNEASVAFQNGCVIGCLFVEPSLNAWNTQKAAVRSIYGITNGAIIDGNIIILNDTSDIHGIAVEGGSHGLVRNNLVYNRAAGIGAGIYADENNGLVVTNVYNNIVSGFSGVGGCGVKTGDANFMLGLLGSNAFYNNTTQESLVEGEIYRVSGDQTLLADPLTDAAGGDYTLTAAAQAALRAAGWPATYLDSTLDPLLSVGALQYGPTPAASGGGFPKIASLLGRTRM